MSDVCPNPQEWLFVENFSERAERVDALLDEACRRTESFRGYTKTEIRLPHLEGVVPSVAFKSEYEDERGNRTIDYEMQPLTMKFTALSRNNSGCLRFRFRATPQDEEYASMNGMLMWLDEKSFMVGEESVKAIIEADSYTFLVIFEDGHCIMLVEPPSSYTPASDLMGGINGLPLKEEFVQPFIDFLSDPKYNLTPNLYYVRAVDALLMACAQLDQSVFDADNGVQGIARGFTAIK